LSLLSDKDLAHLRKLAGMLGSEHDGEVLTAARKASDFLKTRKLTWADVIGGGNLNSAAATIHQRASDVFTEAARRAAEQMKSTWARYDDALTMDKVRVANARIMLDAILDRVNLDKMKRSYFEAIRTYHRTTGFINPTQGAAIDRQFHKNGWDSPLGGGTPEVEIDPNAKIDESEFARAVKEARVMFGDLGDDGEDDHES
jgi:hypothetical protein